MNKKCLDCNNLITRYSIRCKVCAAKQRNRDSNYLLKQSLVQTGQKRSEVARRKMSESQKKRFRNPQNHPRFGKKGLIGKQNGMYVDGRTSLIISLRHCIEYKNWRNQVFTRDSYTCQDCGQYGGTLEAHHKKPFSLIFNDFILTYNQFSLIEDKETLFRLASKYNDFWCVDNGKTLCESCHQINYTTRP